MNYSEALDFISSPGFFGSKPGLERIAELLERLGNPQKKLKYIHIAGTNGKGSCAAMTASVLTAAGYKTGLYTSPYVMRFNERMQINSLPIRDRELAEIVTRIAPLAEGMEDKPTEFELMTAVALLWYRESGCGLAVLEAGLGGRFDATNVIPAPLVAVLMNIGLEHTAVLGGTLPEIAAEKAGIIKSGSRCVAYSQGREVLDVIERVCREKAVSLTVADFSAIESVFDSAEGQVFRYRGEEYALPLLGGHQLKNAAVVLEVVDKLRALGYALPKSDVERGLYSVSWPARFEIVSTEPPFVVDGGHNPQCAESAADSLRRYFPNMRRILLVGVLADKDYGNMFEILSDLADEFVCISPDSPRALPAETLAEHLKRYGKPTAICQSPEDGVELSKALAGDDGMVLAVGSLYTAGRVRACFGLK